MNPTDEYKEIEKTNILYFINCLKNKYVFGEEEPFALYYLSDPEFETEYSSKFNIPMCVVYCFWPDGSYHNLNLSFSDIDEIDKYVNDLVFSWHSYNLFKHNNKRKR